MRKFDKEVAYQYAPILPLFAATGIVVVEDLDDDHKVRYISLSSASFWELALAVCWVGGPAFPFPIRFGKGWRVEKQNWGGHAQWRLAEEVRRRGDEVPEWFRLVAEWAKEQPLPPAPLQNPRVHGGPAPWLGADGGDPWRGSNPW